MILIATTHGPCSRAPGLSLAGIYQLGQKQPASFILYIYFFFRNILQGKDCSINRTSLNIHRFFVTIFIISEHLKSFLVSQVNLLSFQKVCRINFFSWMSERDVTFYSQTLIGSWTIASFVFVGD